MNRMSISPCSLSPWHVTLVSADVAIVTVLNITLKYLQQ
jgi:hypothetical protein